MKKVSGIIFVVLGILMLIGGLVILIGGFDNKEYFEVQGTIEGTPEKNIQDCFAWLNDNNSYIARIDYIRLYPKPESIHLKVVFSQKPLEIPYKLEGKYDYHKSPESPFIFYQTLLMFSSWLVSLIGAAILSEGK